MVLLPGHLQRRVSLLRFVEPVVEPGQADDPAARGERELRETEGAGRPEGVPAFVQPAWVGGHHVPAPLGNLPGDQ